MAKRWYIVQAYSNFERKVAEDIRQKVAQKKLEDLFDDVIVPTEKVVEMRRGRKVDAERKFFPGYVLVKMEMTDQAFHIITALRGTRGVRRVAGIYWAWLRGSRYERSLAP